MKLASFDYLHDYCFNLHFVSGEIMVVDLRALIGSWVSNEGLMSAHLDEEWGCLAFENGRIDIAPKTLYQFATAQPKI